ncbi:Uncharacterised protein [Streptococcus pneumoniae]|nr:Uncharacterised protein [Streptococcus pneumoniae]
MHSDGFLVLDHVSTLQRLQFVLGIDQVRPFSLLEVRELLLAYHQALYQHRDRCGSDTMLLEHENSQQLYMGYNAVT